MTPKALPPTWRASGEELFPELTDRSDGLPWLEMVFDFAVGDDGLPGIRQTYSERPLTGAALRTIPWQRILDRGISNELLNVWYRQVGPGDDYPSSDDEWMALKAEAGTAAKRMRKRRNKITDEMLAEVASVYTDSGGDPDAVADHFTKGRRQADRYIELARERGKLR